MMNKDSIVDRSTIQQSMFKARYLNLSNQRIKKFALTTRIFSGFHSAFTLVEIMIVVAIIGLLAAVAVPSFARARLRAQTTTIFNECRQLDAAKDQYALENSKTGTITPSFPDLTPYLKAGSRLASAGGADLLGNLFIIGDIQSRLQVSASTKTSLSESTGGDTFWGPYS